jgi:hypothetical protein
MKQSQRQSVINSLLVFRAKGNCQYEEFDWPHATFVIKKLCVGWSKELSLCLEYRQTPNHLKPSTNEIDWAYWWYWLW